MNSGNEPSIYMNKMINLIHSLIILIMHTQLMSSRSRNRNRECENMETSQLDKKPETLVYFKFINSFHQYLTVMCMNIAIQQRSCSEVNHCSPSQ
jgi:deoxyadenosine/deoxycytidine kinase